MYTQFLLTLMLTLGAGSSPAARPNARAPRAIGAACVPAAIERAPQDEASELVAVLLEKKDEAGSKSVRELAKLGTRDAMEGLIRVYSEMDSVYMQRAVLRGLASFDGNPELEAGALDRIRDVVLQARSKELRRIAIETLAGCRSGGSERLKAVVNSGVADELRELALRRHMLMGNQPDLEWYYQLYTGRTHAEEAEAAAAGKKKQKKADRLRAERKRAKAGKKLKVYRLQVLRRIAFERLQSSLNFEELMRATGDSSVKIRGMALAELESRGATQSLAIAESIYQSPRYPDDIRVLAAGVILRARGEEIVDRFIKEGMRRDQNEQLALGLADLLVSLHSPKVEKASLKLVGKGKGSPLRFTLRLAAHLKSPRVDKALYKVIRSKIEFDALAAIEILVQRNDPAALEPLHKLVKTSRNGRVTAAAISAIGKLNQMDAAWIEELEALARDADLNIRNAALSSMQAAGGTGFRKAFLEALNHPHWSTRLLAARAIQKGRWKAGVGALVARMQQEQGRPAYELGQILFELTGKSYGMNADVWKRWWNDQGDAFELIGAAELKRLRKEAAERVLKETSRSLVKKAKAKQDEPEYFGIQIRSQHAIFIVDVSGSMQERTRGEFVGDEGPTRLSVAQNELKQAIEVLKPKAFFNLINFSFGVEIWMDALVPANDKNRADAIAYADDFRADGGTNLFAALELAFEDSEVDTVYILSDGEPSMGDVIDPYGILAIVERWNETRNIQFNCIAIGASLDILEALAHSSGGEYVQIQ